MWHRWASTGLCCTDVEHAASGGRTLTHLMGSGGESEPELPAHHHGLIDAPVLTADGAPALLPVQIHQHLHTALRRLPSARQTHLSTRFTLHTAQTCHSLDNI